MAERFNPSAKGQIIKIILSAVILTVAIFFLRKFLEDMLLMALGVVWIGALVIGAIGWIAHLFKTIEIGDMSLKFITGVISVNTIMVPYDRITNVRATRTLFQRLIGLGTLEIDTAGTNLVEVRVPDVPQKYLEEIISSIEQKTHRKVEKV